MLRVQLLLVVVVIASLLVALLLAGDAGGEQESAMTTKRKPCGPHRVVTHRHTIVQNRQFALKVWDPQQWRDKRPIARPRQRERMRHYRTCARRPVAVNRRRMERNQRRTREAFGEHRRKRRAAERRRQEVAALTPYCCLAGQSWAIPTNIVDCESDASWSAANPSGAIGPYQLLGKGAVWPVRSEADKLEHHRIASRLWAGGSGASHWSQCL